MFPEASAVPDGLRRLDFAGMGTTVTVVLPEMRWRAGYFRVRNLFSEWEGRLSRFRPESELNQLNRSPGRAKKVSPLLWEVLETALLAARDTDGLFDPTLGLQMKETGYDRSFELLNRDQEGPVRDDPHPGGAWKFIRLDPDTRSVILPIGSSLDFGGLAKGMAVDAALKLLEESEIQPALVNAGGDLQVLGEPQDGPFSVWVPGMSRAISLRRGAIATSGIGKRNWKRGGKIYHHLLDPRTGRPSTTKLESVTVIAATCGQADVAAKVALLLGESRGPAFLLSQGLAGHFSFQGGKRLSVGAWPRHVRLKEER